MNQHFSVLFTMASHKKWSKFRSLLLPVFLIVTLMMPHAHGNGLQAVHGCTPGSSSNCLPHSAHPTLFDCPSQGFFADPFNCSFYYHCHGDLHYGCVCPCPVVNSNGILTQHQFNNVSNVCVVPSQSNCVPQTTTSLTTSATTSATTSTTTTSTTTSPTASTTTTTTTQSSADGSGSSNSGSAALVIAIIVGLCLIAVSICLLVFFLKWRKERHRQGGGNPEGDTTNSQQSTSSRDGTVQTSTQSSSRNYPNDGGTHLDDTPRATHAFTGTWEDGTQIRSSQQPPNHANSTTRSTSRPGLTGPAGFKSKSKESDQQGSVNGTSGSSSHQQGGGGRTTSYA